MAAEPASRRTFERRTFERRTFETPEGVAIGVELADLGNRAAALLIDLLIIVGSLLVALLLVIIALGPLFGAELGMAMFLLLSFFLRCPYFLFFELRWQGQTPGKRLVGLRVVDRRGGALSASSLAARNLMREVEVFMPTTILMLAGTGAGALETAAALLWMGIFTLMPLFNRDRLRVGDMLGGTWVISLQRMTLDQDLGKGRARGSSRFSKAQLDAYGISELQVLERLLREPTTHTVRQTMHDVCERIRKRIGWREPVVNTRDVEAFLFDYYAALRNHLERHALFGERREDKHAVAGGRSSAAEPPSR